MSNTTELPPRTLLTAAARRLRVAPATAKRLVEKGELDGFLIGCRQYVTTASLDAYIQRITSAVDLPDWARDPRKLQEALRDYERAEAIRETLRDPDKLLALQAAISREMESQAKEPVA